MRFIIVVTTIIKRLLYNSVKINFFLIFYFFSDRELKTLQNDLSDFWKNVYMLRKVDIYNEIFQLSKKKRITVNKFRFDLFYSLLFCFFIYIFIFFF
jgi:hypothetical protein